jgi:hypothetical protein
VNSGFQLAANVASQLPTSPAIGGTSR